MDTRDRRALDRLIREQEYADWRKEWWHAFWHRTITAAGLVGTLAGIAVATFDLWHGL